MSQSGRHFDIEGILSEIMPCIQLISDKSGTVVPTLPHLLGRRT